MFIHGLTGDGKSDRVKEIDPDVLDIELVNETPETINGRAVYNESTDTIIDIKPVWLVKLERLCEDGKPHILFFDTTGRSRASLTTWRSRSLEGSLTYTYERRWRTGCRGRSERTSIHM